MSEILHRPPDTGFEIQTPEVWDRTRYLSVTEAPHNIVFYEWMWKIPSTTKVEVVKKTGTGAHPFNPFEPEFTIVIFIHYKPRIAVAILDL